MNYKDFLKKLKIALDYEYFLEENEKEDSKLASLDKEFANKLFLAPITYSQKEKVYLRLLNGEINTDEKEILSTKLDEIYTKFDKKFNDNKIKTREYTKYLVNFIKKEYFDKLVDQNCGNKIFLFYCVYGIYISDSSSKKTIKLINILLQKGVFYKNDDHYNDLLLYKLVSLKDSNSAYINDVKIMEEVCKIAQNLFGFEYIRIITLLECKLVDGKKNSFEDVFRKNFDMIKNWDIDELLNIMELVVYQGDKVIFNEVDNLLKSKDILLMKEDVDFDIYNFLLAVKRNGSLSIQKYKEKIENKFDFTHFDYFYKKFSS